MGQETDGKELKATTVFTPGAFPLYTYVERTDKQYEARLQDAIDTQGQVVSISGPSKSGKTVLVEKVVGLNNLITVTGAGVDHPDDIWNRILDWMSVPSEVSVLRAEEIGVSSGGEIKGGVGIPTIAGAEASGNAEVRATHQRNNASTSRRRGLSQVVDEISNSDFTVLITSSARGCGVRRAKMGV